MAARRAPVHFTINFFRDRIRRVGGSAKLQERKNDVITKKRKALCRLLRTVAAILTISLLPLSSAAQDNDTPQLIINTRIRKQLSKGERHSYRINLESGQFVRILIDSVSTLAGVSVYAPNDKELVALNCRQDRSTPVSLIARASGLYRLEVRSLEKQAAIGSYNVKVEEIRRSIAQDTIRVRADILLAEGEQLRADETAESSRKAIGKIEAALLCWRAVKDRREEAYALKAIGSIYHPIGKPKKAIDYFKQALLIGQELKDSWIEADVLNDIGFVWTLLGENNKALEYCNRALTLSRNIGNRMGEGNALNNIAEAYYALGNRQKALDYNQQALPLWRNLNDYRGQAQTLLNLGYIFSDLSETKKAENYYNQALAHWRNANNRRGQALTLTAMGHLCSRSGKKQVALEFYNQAKPLIQLVGDPIEEARLSTGIASIYIELGDKNRALALYDKALRLYQTASYRRGEVNSLSAIGGIYYSMGVYDKALFYFQKALSEVRILEDKILEPYALKDIAAIHASMGNKSAAFDHYNQALRLYRIVGDRRGEAYALNGVGSIFDGWGEKEKALDHYNQALHLNRAVGDRFGEVTTLFNITRIERGLGRLAEARSHTEEATKRIESLRSDVDNQELRASYLATVRQNYELYIDTLMLMHSHQPRNDLDAIALHVSEKARARSLIEMLAESRVDIREGVDGALLERERELQKSLNDKTERYSRLLSGKHTQEQATVAAKEIEAITTEIQQVQGQIRSTSPRYAALTQPQPLSLKEIQEQVLDPDTLLLEYALGDDRSYLWAVTQDSIAALELPRRDEIEKRARHVYELLTAQNKFVKGETLQQKTIRINKAEADYIKAAAELSRMILAPAASHLSSKRLLVVADGALQYIPFAALPVPQGSGGGGQGSGKVEIASNSDADVKIANDTTRNYLPRPPTPAPRPLIVDHEIINLPSASALAVLRREIRGRKPAPKAIAVIADPVFSRSDSRFKSAAARSRSRARAQRGTSDLERAIREVGATRGGNELQRLIFSRREAEAITALAPEGQVFKAVEFDASRDRVLSADLSQYRIIHFATHGLLNNEHPELSGIILSLVDKDGRQQNGFLRLHDVYNLRLPAELVVLSACQTGLGKEIKGEGIVGLTRGFMHAGAARVMASLWNVDDAATAELMKRFYTRALGSNMRPAQALREAQIEMWKQRNYQSPYFWAGFVLQGEWK